MEIISYKNASEIPDGFLPSLVDSQIECWGARPFDEYKKCNDCSSLFSIEDIHGSVEQFRLDGRKIAEDFCCTECGGDTEFFYKPEEFIEVVKEYVKDEVSSVLLVTDEKEVEGFSVVSKSTLGAFFDTELTTRPTSYDRERTLRMLSKELFGVTDAQNRDVVIWNRVYVSPHVREGYLVAEMLHQLFSINKQYKGLPIVGECRYDNRLYPILRSIGSQDIVCDKHGYIVQKIGGYEDVLEYFKDASLDVTGILKYKRYAKKMSQLLGFFNDRKSYS